MGSDSLKGPGRIAGLPSPRYGPWGWSKGRKPGQVWEFSCLDQDTLANMSPLWTEGKKKKDGDPEVGLGAWPSCAPKLGLSFLSLGLVLRLYGPCAQNTIIFVLITLKILVNACAVAVRSPPFSGSDLKPVPPNSSSRKC